MRLRCYIGQKTTRKRKKTLNLFSYNAVFVVRLEIRAVIELSLKKMEHFVFVERHFANAKTGVVIFLVVGAIVAACSGSFACHKLLPLFSNVASVYCNHGKIAFVKAFEIISDCLLYLFIG